MAVVVRCTGCGGLARVGPEAVGLLVVCPRCGDPFLADPVPTPAAPAPAPPPTPPAPPRPRPARAEPVAPPQYRPRRRRPAEPVAPPEHHDHPPEGAVPFSVIVGLALLPLTIPLLWLIGPVAVGTAPALTLATPVSLAVAAAALCLAVAFTVDWTPVTRIKGVLMLVGLAYFAGLSLYFLKRDTAEWAQQALGADDWRVFHGPNNDYTVQLPGRATVVPAGPVPDLAVTFHKAAVKGLGRSAVFHVGSGRDHAPDAADAEWFDGVAGALGRKAGAVPGVPAEPLPDPVGLPHRDWVVVPEAKGADPLLVRVYRDGANRRVFVLAAQGPNVDPDDEDTLRFFGSFAVGGGGRK